jgi:hypothetical protein
MIKNTGYDSVSFKEIVFLIYFGCLFSGCSTSVFLAHEELHELSSKKDENSVVYYDEHYTVSPEKPMLVTTHSIHRVGDNIKSAHDYFAVYDGSAYKLLSFEGRVVHADGSEETYSKGDLSSYALSSASMISESRMLGLSLEKSISTGDLIEVVEVHQQVLPELGIQFSPADVRARAKNINWSIELPSGHGFHYRLLHDSLAPVLTNLEGRIQYRFHWDSYVPAQDIGEFDRINPYPELIAIVSKNTVHPPSWREFGDWYLDLIRKQIAPDDSMVILAQHITAGKTTNLEKLDAIFGFCEKNIRYEQVYLAMGEFIPNMAPIILRRKYGDCKDYATVIHTLARCAGVPTNLALCYRGRGNVFCSELPVSQFNHMIVHYEENGADYWYDGTNRIGLPGITTADLINADALVIEQGKSRIVTIKESAQNLLEIHGELVVVKNSLKGTLALTFKSQYAIDFHYKEFYLNQIKMKEAMSAWLQQHLNSQMLISNLSWKTESGQFYMTLNCELPNAVTRIGNSVYTSIDKPFPRLLAEANPIQDSTRLYYYPYYNRISVNVALPQIRLEESNNAFHLNGTMNLPPGPFLSNEQQHQFLECYRAVDSLFSQKIKLALQETL